MSQIMYSIKYELVNPINKEYPHEEFDIKCERLEEARLIHQTLSYIRSEYIVTSRCP